jgi:hypothetical protein
MKPMASFGPNEQYAFAFYRILVKSNSFKFEFLKFRIHKINFIKIQNKFSLDSFLGNICSKLEQIPCYALLNYIKFQSPKS